MADFEEAPVSALQQVFGTVTSLVAGFIMLKQLSSA